MYPRYWLTLLAPIAIYFNSTALQYWAAPFLTSLGLDAGTADVDLLLCGVGPAGAGTGRREEKREGRQLAPGEDTVPRAPALNKTAR